MDSPIDEIKSRLDIVDLVSQYIKLRKTGANFNAVCPFHSEKSGSFFVSPARQTWKCFGCGKGGDMFTFIQEIEGVEFGDAMRILAAKAGVELKKQTRQAAEMKTERQRYYEVCELSVKFFEKQLEGSAAGKEAKNYLLERGLNEQSIAAWRIGYSPDSWQALHDFLASEGYTDAEIIGAGLAGSGSGGRVYDRFRGRIMFPIFDFNSQAVGFGGRIFESKNRPPQTAVEGMKEAKYLNTTNTLLYDKSRILYGLDRAKVAMRRLNACVLVEGYTDVIMSAQAGVENVAASSGTALTPQQLQMLKRFTDNIILGYDMDLAGDTANSRGIEMALGLGFNVSVARPPYEDKDPADVIAQNPDAWLKAVANPKTIMDFYFERAFAGQDAADPKGKRRIAELLLPHIKRVANTIEQSYWLQKLARDLCAREEDLRIELKKVRLNEYTPEVVKTAGAVRLKGRRERLEERVLVLLAKFPDESGLIDEAVLTFFSENGRQIIGAIKEGRAGDPGFEGEIKNYFNNLALIAESETIEKKDARGEIECHLFGDNGIRDLQLKDEHARLIKEMGQAEKTGDQNKILALKEEINKVWREIGELKLRKSTNFN